MPTLLCPVRSCSLPLTRNDRVLACEQRHTFDVARSGYCNLLQPQDRKSNHAGDSRDAVAARRRSLDRGTGNALRDTLLRELASLDLAPGSSMLDAGCGDGFFLASLAPALHLDGWGVDISVPAVDAAARRYHGPAWIVANADRRLPFPDASFSLLTSITAAKHPKEFHRLLRHDGWLVIVVPAPDDQQELREAVLGKASETDRATRATEMFCPPFAHVRTLRCRDRLRLDAEALSDLFAGAYRGLRLRERERLAQLSSLDVTLSHDILLFQRAAGPPADR